MPPPEPWHRPATDNPHHLAVPHHPRHACLPLQPHDGALQHGHALRRAKHLHSGRAGAVGGVGASCAEEDEEADQDGFPTSISITVGANERLMVHDVHAMPPIE